MAILKFEKFKNIIIPILLILAFFALANYFQTSASLSTEETKQNSRTIKLFVFQSPIILSTGYSTTTQFSVFVGEKDPINIKDAYIEIRGIASSGNARNVIIDVNQENSFPSLPPSRQQSFTLGDNSSGPNYFRLLYSGSATASTTQYFDNIINNPGNYNFYLKTEALNTNISALQARIVITYTFTPPSAGTSTYPAYGFIESPVFDTSAANGVTYNKIILKGSTPVGTKIRFQLATAATSTGPWIYSGPEPACDNSSFYWDGVMSAAEESKEIRCYGQHNNKRYFKYKATFCSGDCSNGGSATPQIDDVIINWSP